MVELMVGITVGLIVAAGASMVAVNQINEHRRLVLELQVQQDLRTAADLLQQEMRRAGFRGQADLGVWVPADAPTDAVGALQELPPRVASANQYAPLSVTSDDTNGTKVTYLYARAPYDPNGTPSSNEHFGFWWDKSQEVLKIQLGQGSNGQPNWQPITDPENLRVKDFQLTVSKKTVKLGDFCDSPCDQATGPSCPSQDVREITFKIVGQAKHDPNVMRTLSGTERIRTEAINGVCP